MEIEKTVPQESEAENLFEKQSLSVAIQFDPNNSQQRFVEFETKDNKIYIYSVPGSVSGLHPTILTMGVKYFDLPGGIIRKGGGFLRRDGNTMSVYGKSTFLGGFDKDQVFKLLKEAFPTMDIIIQSE